jgi:hypothetical protein
MRLLRPASEDEMVAAFLAAEATSERYGPQIREILAGLGQPASLARRLPPPVILLGEPGPANLVVVEGHKRLTGLLLCPECLPAELDVVLGLTASHRK